MNLGLEGKVALVSAGSKGLGYGVARALAADGAKVSICSRDGAHVDAAVERLREETGAEVIGMACDVSKPEQIQEWVDSSAAWGPIHALLVNAGGPPGGLALDMTDAQWQALVRVMGSPAWATDARFDMNEGRQAHARIRAPIHRAAEVVELHHQLRLQLLGDVVLEQRAQPPARQRNAEQHPGQRARQQAQTQRAAADWVWRWRGVHGVALASTSR